MSEADGWWFQRTWNDFRRGIARARLSWDGGSAGVLLYDEGVPRTAAAVRAALPLRTQVVNTAWSGEMLMATETFGLAAGAAENAVRLVRPGDLTWDGKYGEICVVYGDAECRLPSGPNTVTVFGQVTDNLEGLAAFGRRRRFHGAGALRLAAEEGA